MMIIALVSLPLLFLRRKPAPGGRATADDFARPWAAMTATVRAIGLFVIPTLYLTLQMIGLDLAPLGDRFGLA
jgi:hypothetical protein